MGTVETNYNATSLEARTTCEFSWGLDFLFSLVREDNTRPKKGFCPSPAREPVGLLVFQGHRWLRKPHHQKPPTPAQVTTHESCLSGVPCTTFTQLLWEVSCPTAPYYFCHLWKGPCEYFEFHELPTSLREGVFQSGGNSYNTGLESRATERIADYLIGIIHFQSPHSKNCGHSDITRPYRVNTKVKRGNTCKDCSCQALKKGAMKRDQGLERWLSA